MNDKPSALNPFDPAATHTEPAGDRHPMDARRPMARFKVAAKPQEEPILPGYDPGDGPQQGKPLSQCAIE